MKLTVGSQKLVKELNLASGVLDRKMTIPMHGNVLLHAHGDSLTLTATNLELAFRATCQANVDQEGRMAIPMRRLLDYVRLLDGADMAISSVSGDAIQITCGRAKTRLPGMDATSFPELSPVPEPVARFGADPLLAAIKRTIISVAEEQSHYTLGAALMVVRRGSIGLVSTDGHRLSLYFEQQQSTDANQDVQSLIGRKAMAELMKVLDQADEADDDSASVSFSVDENNMFFQSGARLFVCRKLTGKFPDYNRVLPKDLDIALELDAGKLGKVLRRVSQFSDERSKTVKFELKDGKLEIAAAVADFGSSEESILVEYEGAPVGVGFNAQYILDFLAVCGSDSIVVRLKDPRRAAQFEVPGQPADKDYRYVIMPIRV